MESLGRTRVVQERVRTYSPGAVRELLEEGLDASQQLEAYRSSSAPSWMQEQPTFHNGTSDNGLRERAAAQRAQREAIYHAKQKQFRESCKRHAAEVERKRDEDFKKLYADVLDGLTASSGLLADVNYTLEHSAKVKSNKSATLKQEWDTQVFDKIAERLQRSVEARSPREIERRLKEHYDQYLHTTNTKVGVFRDVIIEEDYNPLTAQTATIQIPTGDIRDPLKRDMLKPEAEHALMGLPTPRQALGKETLDTRAWGSLQIRSTPYGHLTDHTGSYVVRPASGSAVELRKSRVPMDHYNYPVSNQAAAAEMEAVHGRGKSIVPGPEVRRGRRDLYDVVHHTCALQPKEYTGGDKWLEHKGKGVAIGPEAMRGRVEFKEIIGQAQTLHTQRPQPGQEFGDKWLDAKGKLRAPGPELRRGRPDLFETFQQASNPYTDGRPLGDAWLEHKGRKVQPGKDYNDLRAVLAAVPPPPQQRPPVDDRKYVTHLITDNHQLTAQ